MSWIFQPVFQINTTLAPKEALTRIQNKTTDATFTLKLNQYSYYGTVGKNNIRLENLGESYRSRAQYQGNIKITASGASLYFQSNYFDREWRTYQNGKVAAYFLGGLFAIFGILILFKGESDIETQIMGWTFTGFGLLLFLGTWYFMQYNSFKSNAKGLQSFAQGLANIVEGECVMYDNQQLR